MKLLIITYSYTPDLTPRAFRWSAVAAHLARKGHQVHVLCASAAGDAVAKINDGVMLYRVGDWLLNASSRVTAGAGNLKPDSGARGEFSLRTVFRKMIRSTWRALHWPDYACGWIIPATRAARTLCDANDYDWIISVSHPFTGHVIGLLARLHSPRSRWFVDISDPYSDMKEPAPNNCQIYSRLSRAIEGRVLADAEAISVTTDSTRSLYEASFPVSIGKVRVIPPLLSLPELSPPSEGKSDETIRLVFIGTLYKKLRSPKFLLTCVSALSETLQDRRLELHFYGSINDCGGDFASAPDAMKSYVFIHGLVSRPRVVQAMTDADVLVNIGNDSESQLASKVIEYMAIGKPILNIVSIVRDTSIDALADYPATLTITRSGEMPSPEVVEALRSFVLHPVAVDQEVVDIVRRRYSEEHVAGLYESMFYQSDPMPRH